VLRFGRWCQYAFFGVWNERNLRCFEDVESFMEDILALFFHILYLWIVTFMSPLSLSFVDFVVFLFQVRCFILYTFGVLRGALRFQ
jgi:Ca2+/Na+ antiporter